MVNHIMKLYLDFEPCDECRVMMKELSEDSVLADQQTREEDSAKFLRHLTYNHSEVIKAVMADLPTQKRRQEFDWFK